MKSFSYVTLTTNRDVKGVVALHNSLASNGSSYPVVCLFSELSDSNKARLSKLKNVILREVDPIYNPYGSDNRFPTCFNKLYCWSLEEYDRVIFLDSDVLNLNNMDHLFDHDYSPSLLCVTDPKDYYVEQRVEWYARVKKNRKGEKKTHFSSADWSSGFLILKPDKILFKDLLSKLGSIESFDSADLGFFNTYFKDKISIIDESYNYLIRNFDGRFDGINKFESERDSIYNLHYLGSHKPWHKGRPPWGHKFLWELWNNYYES
jgi:lipopolysaccharide biosynthesis glycosyltransferase